MYNWIKKNIYKIIVLICIFNLIITFHMLWRDSIILYINDENRDFILNILSEYTDTDISSIRKVAYVRRWTHGYLDIYGWLEKKDEILISEGMFSAGDIETYVKEKGYKESDVGKVLGTASLIILVVNVIYKKTRKND